MRARSAGDGGGGGFGHGRPGGYAADALSRSEDNPELAKELLVEWSLDDDYLKDMLLKIGADQVIRNYFSSMRSSAATANGVRVVGLAEGSGRISARIARREFWEKYTLFGKRPLKTATKVALEDSVKNRRNQVSGNLARADFEERVSKKMNDEQVVQDCWKIQELMALANRCHVRM